MTLGEDECVSDMVGPGLFRHLIYTEEIRGEKKRRGGQEVGLFFRPVKYRSSAWCEASLTNVHPFPGDATE